MEIFRIKRVNGNKIIQPGVDYGTDVFIIGENETHLIIRWPGHMGWVGRGEQGYYSPHLLVFEKHGREGKYELAREVESVEYSRDTRKETYKTISKKYGIPI